MKKSTWGIDINDNGCGDYWWDIFLRSKPSMRFCWTGDKDTYTRRDSAIRGAKRMAKRLRISAEIDQ